MPERILYTWVHLSDIHFGHGDPDWCEDQRDVVDKLITDVREALDAADESSPDALILTGDIAFAGKPDEFIYAEEMIRDIVEAAGGDPRVYTVAGNHDVVRTTSDNLSEMRLIEGLRSGRDRLADVLTHGPDVAALERRFAPYRDFCERVGSPFAITTAWTEGVKLSNGVILRFVGWNSGLLCQDNSDRGRLSLPVGSAIASVRHRKSNEIVVVMTHHDLDWLQEECRTKLTSLSGLEARTSTCQATNTLLTTRTRLEPGAATGSTCRLAQCMPTAIAVGLRLRISTAS